MSMFAKRITEEIKTSRKTLIYLAEASGLTVDHISKMRLDKRLPKDEEKVKKLIAALNVSPQVETELLHLYQRALIGNEKWACFKEVRTFLNQKSGSYYMTSFSDETTTEKDRPEFLEGKASILPMIQRIISQSIEKGYVVRIITEASSVSHLSEIAGMISSCIPSYTEFSSSKKLIEHLFPLAQNTDYPAVLFNTRMLNAILPMIQRGTGYVPRYYYKAFSEMTSNTDTSTSLYGCSILTEEQCMLISPDFMEAMITYRPDHLKAVLHRFESIGRHTVALTKWYTDLAAYCQHLFSYQTSGDVKHHTAIEYGPCLLMSIPETMCQAHIKETLPDEIRKHCIEIIRTRKSVFEGDPEIHCFTMSGVRSFLRTGRVISIPDVLYNPLTPEERVDVLNLYLQEMQSTESEFFVINESLLPIADSTSLYISSAISNDIAFVLPSDCITYCSISEPSLSLLIKEFADFVPNSIFVYPKEEGLAKIQETLREFKAHYGIE